MHLRISPLPRAALTLLAMLLLPGGVARGEDPATDPSAAEPVPCTDDVGRIIYTLHHPSGGPPPAPVTLNDGERFAIKVTDTLPDLFTYRLYRQRVAGKRGRATADKSRPSEICLSEVHDKRFGGYLLAVLRTSTEGAEDYPPSLLISIPVQTPQWTYGFAGGFVGSGLTDPVYFVRKDETGASVVKRAGEDGTVDEEDWAKLGTAAFIHVTPPRGPLALSFGIGISDGDKPTYYLGPSYRLGDQAFITAGLAVGPVDALPAGIAVGDRLDDPNALASLRSRNKGHVFVALSYAFLGSRKDLARPFAPTDASAPVLAPQNAGSTTR